MTLGACLVLAGYAGIVWHFGWLGAGMVAAHLAVLALFVRRRRR